MYKTFYEGMGLGALPLFALVLFVSLFVVVVVRTFVLRRARDFDRLAAMPLGDDPNE